MNLKPTPKNARQIVRSVNARRRLVREKFQTHKNSSRNFLGAQVAAQKFLREQIFARNAVTDLDTQEA
jgi:hypothetical protein